MRGGQYVPVAVAFALGLGLAAPGPVASAGPGGRKLAVAEAAPAARPPAARPPARPKPTVVLDPGHGGIDFGAVGFVAEKTVALDVSLKLKGFLEARGVNVVMTRQSDWAWQKDGTTAQKRRDLQQRANFASTSRNLFVSVHANSSASPAASGIETWVFGEPLEPSTLAQAERENGGGAVGRAVTAEARRVAGSIQGDVLAEANLRYSRQLAAEVLNQMLVATGARSRGVKQTALYVLRSSRIPAMLVEVGFVRNPTEGPKLATSAYRQRVAEGIAEGISRFLQ